jgi:hypothetical protein
VDKKSYAILGVIALLGVGIGFAATNLVTSGDAAKIVKTVERSFSQ